MSPANWSRPCSLLAQVASLHGHGHRFRAVGCMQFLKNGLQMRLHTIRPNTRILYTETLGNPTLAVANIPALADLANRHGITLIVDNTFTPMVISPACLGAHIVVHSMTKYINGAADLLAGCVCCSREFGHSL